MDAGRRPTPDRSHAVRVDSRDDRTVRPRDPPRGHPLHRGHPGRLPEPRLHRRSIRRDGGLPGARAGAAAAARRRGRGRQDRARQGAGRVARHAPDPAPVLRGPRRQHRRLRVELPAPDARDPAARGARRGRARDRARHLRRRLPDPPATPPGDRVDRRRRARSCSSTRSTVPTRSSRPSCSRSCRTSRSRSPRSARSRPRRRRG